MAANSAAQRRAERDAAGYTTGHSLSASRCDGCVHQQPASGHLAQTKYDRHCSLFVTSVKTHGHCRRHQVKATAKPLEITVRYLSGAHQTNTVQGQRASSTFGYEDAAQRLCRKLFPTATVDLVKVRSGTALEVFHATVRKA